MIDFSRYTLPNGLRLIVHRDENTPIVTVNTIFDVGARDENPGKTGFAHLFEHLMFGGSVNIPNFDGPLQHAGGSNNAFTNNDFTNYYITIPAQNIETALWLESDRMLSLAFTDESLEVQRKVVIEEFRQRYLNRPYGELWLELRPLAYQVHPYKWATIGEKIEHIENAEMDEVRAFFRKFYHPANAILTIAGNVEPDRVFDLVKKWYGDIPAGAPVNRNLSREPRQTENRRKVLEREVPLEAFHMAWHMPGRLEKKYCAYDLLSDILSGGESSRLFKRLVKGERRFTDLNAYIMGSIDPGLFVVSGMISRGSDIEEARAAVFKEIQNIADHGVDQNELQKVKNNLEAHQIMSETGVLSKAMSLGYYELLGDANQANTYLDDYRSVTAEDIAEVAREISGGHFSELQYRIADAEAEEISEETERKTTG